MLVEVNFFQAGSVFPDFVSKMCLYEYYPRDTQRGYAVRKLEISSGNIIHKVKAIVSSCKKFLVQRCASSRRKLRRPKPESGTSPDPDFDRHSAVMRAADTRQALNLALRAVERGSGAGGVSTCRLLDFVQYAVSDVSDRRF